MDSNKFMLFAKRTFNITIAWDCRYRKYPTAELALLILLIHNRFKFL